VHEAIPSSSTTTVSAFFEPVKSALTMDYPQNHLRHNCLRFLAASFALIAICSLTCRSAYAQFDHSDAVFGYDAGKIAMDQTVYSAVFPTLGISKQFTSNPGFASETDIGSGGIGSNEEVIYNVLDHLHLWDGTTFIEPADGTFIRIQNNPPTVPATIVSNQSGSQEGSIDPPVNRIGRASGNGNVHAHVNFTLDTEEGSEPQRGVYGIKLSLETSNESIAASDPFFFVYNFGLDIPTFRAGVQAYEQLLSNPSVPGDFNGDGLLDAADIDLLTLATFSAEPESEFDLNSDGQVNGTDRSIWVEELKSTYFGDSNLDGAFTSGDLVAVFQRGEYEDLIIGNSTWETGDWDGDFEFGSGDFVLAFQAGGYELGPRQSVAAVPEPTSGMMLITPLLLWGWFGRTPIRHNKALPQDMRGKV
jgi:hypothetical protein